MIWFDRNKKEYQNTFTYINSRIYNNNIFLIQTWPSISYYFAMQVYLICPRICEINILPWLFAYSRNFHRFHNCYSKYFRNNAPNLIKRQHLFRKLPKGKFNLWGGPKSEDDFGNRALETSSTAIFNEEEIAESSDIDRVGREAKFRK